ncbi:MAG: NAD(P)/FAD-dependent oxidoreductase [Geminicoccaceae bacterium]|nr:MAG: NAD(P)/FAD-dependent oxidoreductase [Geminicoccaceae bacterium]
MNDLGYPPADAAGLDALEARLAHDLACLNHPPANWVPPTQHPTHGRVLDVVVIGGGMCGLVASFALIHGGMSHLRIFDRSPKGFEGPWVTYARMETLRSPKQLTGPAYGLGALSFRAWYEARFGTPAWEALDKIPRPLWMDYLRWYRQVLRLPVENEVEVTRVSPEDGFLRLDLAGAGAKEPFVLTRKLVMATGREGMGQPTIPPFVDGLERGVDWMHSADAFDFARLRDKRVVVVGVGASAVDNAAEALEAGASECRLLIRRKEMPRINKMMGIGSFGFTAGFPTLDDAWRWRFMHYSFTTQTPAPRGSTLRVSRHANAFFHFDCGIARITRGEHGLVVETVHDRRFLTDFVILGTGFTIEPDARPELADVAGRIALWRDRYTPPPHEAHPDMASFPYLSGSFAFQPREPGDLPWLQDVHCFNYGATISLGKISGDIPAISDGAAHLAKSLAADLYRADIDRHWQTLQTYDKPELLGDEWTVAE